MKVTDKNVILRIKPFNRRTKDMLYRAAIQEQVSMSELVRRLIRDYLYSKFPDETIE